MPSAIRQFRIDLFTTTAHNAESDCHILLLLVATGPLTARRLSTVQHTNGKRWYRIEPRRHHLRHCHGWPDDVRAWVNVAAHTHTPRHKHIHWWGWDIGWPIQTAPPLPSLLLLDRSHKSAAAAACRLVQCAKEMKTVRTWKALVFRSLDYSKGSFWVCNGWKVARYGSAFVSLPLLYQDGAVEWTSLSQTWVMIFLYSLVSITYAT